ncbi:MAG: hypothetical protein K2X66_13420 [Cyanobacteria bacterium]|nr:hypothetical protein [Cyanobacteriota bacterium]
MDTQMNQYNIACPPPVKGACHKKIGGKPPLMPETAQLLAMGGQPTGSIEGDRFALQMLKAQKTKETSGILA